MTWLFCAFGTKFRQFRPGREGSGGLAETGCSVARRCLLPTDYLLRDGILQHAIIPSLFPD